MIVFARKCQFGEVETLLTAALNPKTDSENSYSAAGMAGAGECYAVYLDSGEACEIVAAYILQRRGESCLWVALASGVPGGKLDMAVTLDRLITQQAGRGGYAEVAFLTERKGLIRRAQKRGYAAVCHHRKAHYLSKRVGDGGR